MAHGEDDDDDDTQERGGAQTAGGGALVTIRADVALTRYAEERAQIELARSRADEHALAARQAPDLEDATRAIQRAIDEDMLQIEASLTILRSELDRGQAQVEEVAARAREVSQRASVISYNALERVSEARNWRSWVRSNPWKAVGIGLAVGFYVGGLRR